MLRSSLKRGASLGLCLLLVLPTISVAAGNPSALGTLRSDGAVFVGGEKARVATALYGGDHVRTADGRATISLNGGYGVVIDRESSAALRQSSEGVVLLLEKGHMAWSANSKGPLQIETDGLLMSPSESFPALAEVARRNDGSIVLGVHKGTIAIRHLREEAVMVSAGKFITIGPRLSQSQEPQSQPIGTGSHGKMTLGEKLRTFQIGHLSHAASVGIVLGAVGAAAATAIAVPLAVGTESSPSAP